MGATRTASSAAKSSSDMLPGGGAGAALGARRETSNSSAPTVRTSVPLANRARSQPKKRATTVASVATPRTRRTTTSAAPARLRRAMRRLPMVVTAASDMMAPRAKVRKSSAARGAPDVADAAMSNPRIGPAQGAHSSPMAMPTTTLRAGVTAFDVPPMSAAPARVAGRVSHSLARVESSVIPTSARSSSAASRPISLATSSQCAVALAMSAAPVKASARPTSMGAISRRKLRPVRAKMSGITGRMHGLRIVSTPPRKARRRIVILVPAIHRPGHRRGTARVVEPFGGVDRRQSYLH